MIPSATTSELARRIIPCLDVKDGQVVKGVRFKQHRVVGDIVELSQRYRDAGADELVLYDITASPRGESVDANWVERIARTIDIPFCVAGGIRSVQAARTILNRGADKISVNSPAVANPELISELAGEFGCQCVVVGIDSYQQSGKYWVKSLTGDPDKTRDVGIETLEWIQQVQRLGAGEIVLNCMNQDGVRQGYDVEQLKLARQVCRVPLIASGGAGTQQHFADVFTQSQVDGALAASVFHQAEIGISDLKQFLSQQDIKVRQ